MIKSYGIRKLEKYLEPVKNDKLNAVANNADAKKIKKVVEAWK